MVRDGISMDYYDGYGLHHMRILKQRKPRFVFVFVCVRVCINGFFCALPFREGAMMGPCAW